VETDEFVGFGTWKYRDLDGYGRVIDIAYLGVVSKFKGEVDHARRKLAARLYAAVEEDALAGDETTPDMPIHLVCDERNGRGLAFWVRIGFEEIDRQYIGALDITYVHMIR
jgi:hypothetical protein